MRSMYLAAAALVTSAAIGAYVFYKHMHDVHGGGDLPDIEAVALEK